jgi:hypothetical protein
MDLSRLRRGERIAAGAALLLFIDMFLHWYKADIGNLVPGVKNLGIAVPDLSAEASLWQATSILDIFLLLVIIVALGLAFLSASGRSVALPVAASVITAVLGAIATLVVLLRLIDQPGPDSVVDIKVWAWIGLLLCAAIAYGGWTSMRDEGTNLSDARGQAERAIRGDAPPADATRVHQPPPPEPLGTTGDQETPPTVP